MVPKMVIEMPPKKHLLCTPGVLTHFSSVSVLGAALVFLILVAVRNHSLVRFNCVLVIGAPCRIKWKKQCCPGLG